MQRVKQGLGLRVTPAQQQSLGPRAAHVERVRGEIPDAAKGQSFVEHLVDLVVAGQEVQGVAEVDVGAPGEHFVTHLEREREALPQRPSPLSSPRSTCAQPR